MRGEDLDYNYRLATAIAPETCPGCARYHINFTLGRLAGLTTPYGSDEPQFGGFIGEFAEAWAGARPLKITIVGAGDTGLLSLVAHLTCTAGLIDRTRFHVIDICDTPLRLCREYGNRHGLQLRTTVADVTRSDPNVSADLMVVHSLLRFIPADARVRCLRQWRNHLSAGGRMVLSNTFTGSAGPEAYSPYTDALRTLVERDALVIAEPKHRFLTRLDQSPPWHITSMTRDDLLANFREAGLVVESVATVKDKNADRGRLVAVLAAA